MFAFAGLLAEPYLGQQASQVLALNIGGSPRSAAQCQKKIRNSLRSLQVAFSLARPKPLQLLW